MALAIRFEGLIADGTVSDYSELAELAQVSRARMTQIMNQLLLAPDIQESLLFMVRTKSGRDALTLADLQTVSLEVKWQMQREVWLRLCNSSR
jgi:hypothetical protein